MPAIPPKSTATVDEPWDANAEVDKIPNDAGEATLRDEYAWVDTEGDPKTKAAYKFPHHRVDDGKPGPANLSGCRNGLARLTDAKIPESDKAGVRAHLQRHLDDGDRKSGGKKTELFGTRRPSAESWRL
jgi:hypothetical protein